MQWKLQVLIPKDVGRKTILIELDKDLIKRIHMQSKLQHKKYST